MLFIVDNYDSFVYNIVHTIEYPDSRIIIKRNDEFDIDEVTDPKIKAVMISPGPRSPKEAGRSIEVIQKCSGVKPILGICLGHQCIGEAFGCTVSPTKDPVHGKKSKVFLEQNKLFLGLERIVEAARYHSLIIHSEGFNDNILDVIARLEDGTIMGIKHKNHPTFGLQFHPESILTKPIGKKIFNNFLNIAGLI